MRERLFRHLRVLIVEDNPNDVRLLEQALRRAGIGDIELVHSRDIASAERFLREQAGQLEALLLDLSLPDSEGLATVRRARIFDPNLPIVVLTGQTDAGLGLSAVHEGA